MDIARPDLKRRRRWKAVAWAGLAAVAAVLAAVGVARLEPAVPTLDRSRVFVGEATRGSMTVDVRGLGILAPEQIVLIPARDEGRVEERPLQPGVAVAPETVLFVLSNPQLEQEVFDVEAEIRAAEAEYADLEVRLETERLDQAALAAQIEGQFEQAKAQVDVDRQLAADQLLDALTLRKSEVAARQLQRQVEIENSRLAIRDKAVEAQLTAKRARIDQQRRLLELRREKLRRLTVRAGATGVLQKLEVEVGQFVKSGDILARVSDPRRLKAELRIPETQAKDILLGLPVEIDTRNGVVPGSVMRIDPAVREGTVTIDVRLEGELPAGARPDLSVDGRVILRKLDDVVKIDRPIHAQSDATLSLFRLDPDGVRARRVRVRIGATSIREAEVVEGLVQGDRAILSDLTGFDGRDELVLN